MTTAHYITNDEKAEVLQTALSSLRPVIALLLDAGINTQEVTRYVRQLSVAECAARQIRAGKKPSVSQIAAATGLSRPEVRQLLKSDTRPHEAAPIFPRRTDRTLMAWRTETEFLKADGTPQPLSYSGSSPNFSDLVQKHGGDIPPRAMLKQMHDSAQIVEISPNVFLPAPLSVRSSEGRRDQLRAFGSKLAALGETLLFNLHEHPIQPRFEQISYVKGLTPAQATRVTRDLNRRCTAFSQGIERYLLDVEQETPLNQETHEKVAIGIMLAIVEKHDQPDETKKT